MKKVVIIGPESTGKSTLCTKLAAHYHTIWVKEYAREYLLKNGTEYSYENLLEVAKGQVAGEALALKNCVEDSWSLLNKNIGEQPAFYKQQPVFIDTDLLVLKVWCEFVFDKCHDWILNQIVAQKYDLYLLCNIDAPWVKDELREYPDWATREKLYHHYKDIMVNQWVPWIDISGTYEERLQKAIAGVDNIIQ